MVRLLRAMASGLARLPRGAAALLALGWAALIWWLLGGRGVAPEPWFWFMGYAYDLSHAAFFGVFSVWCAAAWRADDPAADAADEVTPFGPTAVGWLVAAGVSLLYGGLMEWRQAAVPGRHASWFDLATDAVGAFGLPWVLSRPSDGPRRAALVLLAAGLCALAAREL